MQKITLDTATQHILQACVPDQFAFHRRPFFFFVGAGISVPCVPTASEIVTKCKGTVAQTNVSVPPHADGLDAYTYWFREAYQHPVQRQRFIRSLIQGAPISRANLRLAHLLIGKKISNLVLTTNFDDLLSRALNLFNQPHLSFDHPGTIDRIDPENDDIQIVHVHGTYWFYDCCNLLGEIEDRANRNNLTSPTMGSFIDSLLLRRSPLVIGYSGWENDVFMTSLKRRLQNKDRLPYNLYWFCFKADDCNSLPKWLTDHGEVFLVLPDDHKPERCGPELAIESTDAPLAPPQAVTGQSEATKTLSAHRVLDSLIQFAKLSPPSLTTNPLACIVASLCQIESPENEDTYLISNVIDRIRRADRLEREFVQEIEKQLELVRNAMRSSQYAEAIRICANAPINDLDRREKEALIPTILRAAESVENASESQERAYEIIIRLGESLDQSSLKERLAVCLMKAYLRKAIACETRHDSTTAMSCYDRGTAIRSQVPTEQYNENLHVLWIMKCQLLNHEKRHQEAIKAAEIVIANKNKINNDRACLLHCCGLNGKAIALSSLERYSDAASLFCEIQKLAADNPKELSDFVGPTILNLANCLFSMRKHDDAQKMLEDLVLKCKNSENTLEQLWSIEAILRRSRWFKRKKRYSDELAYLRSHLSQFKDTKDCSVRRGRAMLLFECAMALDNLDQHQEEDNIYGEIVREFEETEDIATKRVVASAYFYRALNIDEDEHPVDAAAEFERTADKFSNVADGVIAELAARSRVRHVQILTTLNRKEDETKAIKLLRAALDANATLIQPFMPTGIWSEFSDKYLSSDDQLLCCEKILNLLLQNEKSQEKVSQQLRANLNLVLLGLGKIDEIFVLFNPLPKPESLDIIMAFNLSMGIWARNRTPPRSYLDRVVRLDRGTHKKERGPNYQQCLALSLFLVGKTQDAKTRIQKAITMAKKSSDSIYSCWTYRRVTAKEFVSHCEALLALISGANIGPPFLLRKPL